MRPNSNGKPITKPTVFERSQITAFNKRQNTIFVNKNRSSCWCYRIEFMLKMCEFSGNFPANFADRVTNLTVGHFEKISGSFINKTTEWTVLSSILKYDNRVDDLEVVSLGTGSKCLGSDQMSTTGDILNDSHAEILSRRAFIRYLYDQLEKFLQRDQCGQTQISNIFHQNEALNNIFVKPEITFHFFSTHPPCGDASISLPTELNSTECDEPITKRRKIDGINIQQTGAKLLTNNSEAIDLMAQDIGAIRTKPGRGVRTLSVSCSDKMSRWTFLGIQGSLLHSILQSPIYLKSITIMDSSYSIDSLKRAVTDRWNVSNWCVQSGHFKQHPPIILKSSGNLKFELGKCETLRPSPNSLIWCKVDETPKEVSVGGIKQGGSRKCKDRSKTRVRICKYELFRKFLRIRQLYKSEKCDNTDQTYRELKDSCSDYLNAWLDLKQNVFRTWTIKPKHLEEFKI